MPISVTCDCGKSYELSDDMAGRRGKCPECGNALEIPAVEISPVEVIPSVAPNLGEQEAMNCWNDVRNVLLREFTVQGDDGESVDLVLAWEGGRSQFVIVGLVRAVNGDEWMSIKSPIGVLPAEILPRVCETVHDKVCGGLVKFGDRYWLRHSVPIGNTLIDELLTPVRVVAGVADEIEEIFVGGDAQ